MYYHTGAFHHFQELEDCLSELRNYSISRRNTRDLEPVGEERQKICFSNFFLSQKREVRDRWSGSTPGGRGRRRGCPG